MSLYRSPALPPSPISPCSSPPAMLPLSSPEPPQLTRHPDLWFSDGSVVLHAEDTLFRVHMSQLSRRSVIFHDMFSLPQPDACAPRAIIADETYDGCPLVRLHDSADDVASLLTALYDGPSFGCNDLDDFVTVAGILRLSTKYVMDSLRAKALAHLSLAWPSTLKGWDAREDRARAFELESSSEGAYLYPSPIAVINLARETNAHSLLASAFYDLSRYTYAQIFELCDDTSSRFRPCSGASSPLVSPLPLSMLALSTGDMQKLALGKEAASLAVSAVIHGMGRGPHAHARKGSFSFYPHPHSPTSHPAVCSSPGACRRDFAELVALATQHYVCDRERGCADPLYVAEELGALKSAEASECRACARALEIWAAKERERMWKMIPLWFRLDS